MSPLVTAITSRRSPLILLPIIDNDVGDGNDNDNDDEFGGDELPSTTTLLTPVVCIIAYVYIYICLFLFFMSAYLVIVVSVIIYVGFEKRIFKYVM